jgi:hypothetical protein
MSSSRTAQARRSRLRRLPRGRARVLLAGMALVLFALRALVPVGFEPASDGSLSLVICRDGFPAPLHHAGAPARGGGAAHNDHCLFCNSPGTAPAPLLLALAAILLLVIATPFLHTPSLGGLRPVHVPQARAPPALI